MASSIRLISNATNYYLSGLGPSQTPYNGSGTPWTAQSTTPYEIAMTSGEHWTPQAAVRTEAYGGGPPFANGSNLIYDAYGNVVETVPIQMRATSHDNGVALLRQLRQILNTSSFDAPCILAVQPNGATNTVYYEIISADVQETDRFINDEAKVAAGGRALVRATVTWRRRPLGSAGAVTTLINAATFNNTGTGTPDNIEAYAALSGDHVYEGMPLNMRFNTTVGAAAQGNLYCASIHTRVYASINNAQTTTTTANFTTTTPTLDAARSRPALRMRVLARFKTLTAPAKAKFRCNVLTGGMSITTPYQLFPAGSSTTAYLMDFGGFDLSTARVFNSSQIRPVITISIASTDGTSVTATLDYVETLLYYTFCRIAAGSTSSQEIDIEQAADYNASGLFFPVRPRAYDTAPQPYTVAGTYPQYFSGASMYLAWNVGIPANSNHTTTAAVVVTVTGLPTYATLRGNG